MYVVMTSGMVGRMYFGWIQSTFFRKQTSLIPLRINAKSCYHFMILIKGKLSWAVNLKKTAWTFQVWFKAKPPAYDGPLAAKEITPDKRTDSANESGQTTWYVARIYLNACAAHDNFLLTLPWYAAGTMTKITHDKSLFIKSKVRWC